MASVSAARDVPVRDRRSLSRNLESRVASRSLQNNQLKAKLLGPFCQRSDLLFAISGLVVFGALVRVLLAVLDEPENRQASLRAMAVIALGAPNRVRRRRYCAPR